MTDFFNAKGKRECRQKTQMAYKRGYIQKSLVCQRCNVSDLKLEKHHPDYTKPMVIRWLCKPCHRIEDKERRVEYPADFNSSNSYVLNIDIDETQEIPKQVMKTINSVARELGYTSRRVDATKSRWKLVLRALIYAKHNPNFFKF